MPLIATLYVALVDAFTALAVQLVGHTSWYVSGVDRKLTLAVHTTKPADTELNHVDAGAKIVDSPDVTDEHEPDELRNRPLNALTLETDELQP